MELLALQGLAASGAGEALLVPLLVHGRHNDALDVLLALGALLWHFATRHETS